MKTTLSCLLFLIPVFRMSVYAQLLTSERWIHSSIDSMLPGSEYGTSGFTLDDFDMDGDLDITISRREISGGQVYWYENSQDTWKRHDLGISDKLQLGAASIDLNDDGFPDLVVSRYWFENPGVLKNFPDSAWPRHIYPGGLPNENHDIMAYDFNRDGKKEFLCYSQNAGGGTLRIYNMTLAGVWNYNDVSNTVNNTVSHIPNSNGVHGGFAPHGAWDLNGDSFADIVMPAGWYKNPGRGPDTTWQYTPWPFRTGITPNLYGISIRSWVTDLDGDHDNDIVYTDCDNQDSKGFWIENVKKGRDFIQHALSSPGDPTGSLHSLAVADFDKDGDFDIFTGEQEDPDPGMKAPGLNERGFFWENIGRKRRPVFVARIIQTGNPGWHDVQTGDVDGDGDTDIVSKVWNKDGTYYHVDLWKNTLK